MVTEGINISGGTVNASITGKAGIRKVALITGGDLNITGGITTLRGDYPIFISANGGGSLSFGGTPWYQWAESPLETPVMSTETPYTYAFSQNNYLRIEPIGTTYSLTVEGGEGSGSYTAGSEVTISAEPYNGQGHFSEWTVTGADAGDILTDSTAAAATITMPAASVTATANYESHVPQKNAGKDPTCTSEGYTGDTVCEGCGVVLEKGEVIPMLAHSFEDGKCTVCGAPDPDYDPANPTGPTNPTDPTNPTGPADTAGSAGQSGSAAKAGNTPRTGDADSLTLWLLILAASGCVLAGALAYNRRRKY